MNILLSNEITKVSIPVTDVEAQVKPYIKEMAELCRVPRNGRVGLAIAHCQVDADNPRTFYTFANGDTVVNPIISLVKVKTLTWHGEGCLSFPNRGMIMVPRFRIIKASYILVNNNGVKVISNKTIQGIAAYVMQHETDHFNLKYVYDTTELYNEECQ